MQDIHHAVIHIGGVSTEVSHPCTVTHQSGVILHIQRSVQFRKIIVQSFFGFSIGAQIDAGERQVGIQIRIDVEDVFPVIHVGIHDIFPHDIAWDHLIGQL